MRVDTLPGIAQNGSLPLALLVSALAGFVSFASPCVLPLVPGYLGYVTGLTGVDLERQRRGRMFAGAALFVLGFTVVFVTLSAAFGGLGRLLIEHQLLLTRVFGVVTIVLGLVFIGWFPGSDRGVAAALAADRRALGAPLLGAVFGLGWIPCVGPTLGAVLALASSDQQRQRDPRRDPRRGLLHRARAAVPGHGARLRPAGPRLVGGRSSPAGRADRRRPVARRRRRDAGDRRLDLARPRDPVRAAVQSGGVRWLFETMPRRR